MADTVVEVVSKQDFAAAQKEIADLRAKNESLQESKVKEQVSALEKTVASKNDELKNSSVELENVKASKKEVEKQLDVAKAALEDANKKLAEAQKSLDENKKVVVRANRISILVDKGVDKVEAEKLVDSYASADDNLFTIFADAQGKLVEAAKAAFDFEAEKKKKEGKKDEKKKAEADEKKLDETDKGSSTEAALSVETEADTDSVIAGLSDFLSQALDTVNKKK